MTQLRLPRDLHADLQEIADIEGWPLGDTIVAALRKYVEAHKRARSR